ncbi:MAG: hypothetical protein AVDCRST_MAG38-285, partial [uncultured Solirubrobacteraceae bacterium]
VDRSRIHHHPRRCAGHRRCAGRGGRRTGQGPARRLARPHPAPPGHRPPVPRRRLRGRPRLHRRRLRAGGLPGAADHSARAARPVDLVDRVPLRPEAVRALPGEGARRVGPREAPSGARRRHHGRRPRRRRRRHVGGGALPADRQGPRVRRHL